ncbi:MAG: hypothetical protein ACRENP_01865 [Longimicrobiales bacterium]
MKPVPYAVQSADIDEVLSAYEPVGGGAWTEEARQDVRAYVMRHVLDLDDATRTAPEDATVRREVALAAIEDLLIRDGLLDITDREKRVFPIVTTRDTERDDF